MPQPTVHRNATLPKLVVAAEPEPVEVEVEAEVAPKPKRKRLAKKDK